MIVTEQIAKYKIIDPNPSQTKLLILSTGFKIVRNTKDP